MKKLIRNSLVVFAVGVTSIAFAAVPAINVTVSDSTGKAAFKGPINSSGNFSTGTLKKGGYVVQFNSKSASKGTHYALVVSAGTKKVTASGVDGEKFAKGGVAMKIDVGAGLNITGQVADEKNSASTPMGKNGKPMVWIPKKLGSNLSPHWAESDSAEAKEAVSSTSMSRQDLQNRQNQSISPGGN